MRTLVALSLVSLVAVAPLSGPDVTHEDKHIVEGHTVEQVKAMVEGTVHFYGWMSGPQGAGNRADGIYADVPATVDESFDFNLFFASFDRGLAGKAFNLTAQEHTDAGIASMQRQGWADAVREFSVANQMQPTAQRMAMLAEVYYDQSDYPNATVWARKAIAADPALWLSHDVLGVVLGRDDAVAGEKELLEAIRLNAAYGGAREHYGDLLLAQHKTAAAKVEYAEALRLDGTLQAEIADSYKQAAERAKKTDEATEEYAEAARLDPKLAGQIAAAYRGLGEWAIRRDLNLEGAKAEYAAALQLDANDYASHDGLGRILRAEGKPAEAEVEFNTALRLQPNDGDAICAIGLIRLASGGNPKDALKTAERGTNAAKNYSLSMLYYQELSDAGNGPAMNHLGWVYQNGEGVTRDYAQAVQWYRKAAEIGNTVSMLNIGSLYENGEGVTKDDVQAVAWYRKAADAGDAKGMYNLGVMYEAGQGVTKDIDQAVSWYRKGAAAGNEAAKTNLARLTGKTVAPPDC